MLQHRARPRRVATARRPASSRGRGPIACGDDPLGLGDVERQSAARSARRTGTRPPTRTGRSTARDPASVRAASRPPLLERPPSASRAHRTTRSGDAAQPPLVHSGRRWPSGSNRLLRVVGSSVTVARQSSRPSCPIAGSESAGRSCSHAHASGTDARHPPRSSRCTVSTSQHRAIATPAGDQTIGGGAIPPHPARPQRALDRRQPTPPDRQSRTTRPASPTANPTPHPVDRSPARRRRPARPRSSRNQSSDILMRSRRSSAIRTSSLARPFVGHTGAVLFEELALASRTVAATSKRTEKIAALADVLRQARPGRDRSRRRLRHRQRAPRAGSASAGRRSSDVRPDPASQPTLTVDDVHDAIDALAAIGGGGSVARRRELAARAARAKATEPEQQMIRAILGGELRQGALDGVMAAAVAKAAGVSLAEVQRGAMFAGSLATAARVALTEGSAGLAAIELSPTHPVQPMLASPAASVADALAETGLASVEWKLDGARIQAHRAAGDVRLYTRNLNDVTDRLGGVVEVVRAAARRRSRARRRGARSRRHRHAAPLPGHDGRLRRRRDRASVPGAATACRRSSSTSSTPAPASSTSRWRRDAKSSPQPCPNSAGCRRSSPPTPTRPSASSTARSPPATRA